MQHNRAQLPEFMSITTLVPSGRRARVEEASLVALVVKNLPASAGDIRDAGLVPGLGRSPGGEHGNPLQYSCLENPMDRGAWLATVHRAAKSWTRLKRLSTHSRVEDKKLRTSEAEGCSPRDAHAQPTVTVDPTAWGRWDPVDQVSVLAGCLLL